MGGIKLLLEDLGRGTATTLVVAFVAYGAALMLVPRLSKTSLPEHEAPALEEKR